jgi:hypothetical protein
MRRNVSIGTSFLLAALCGLSAARAATPASASAPAQASTPAAAASAAQQSWANHRHAFTVRLIQLSPEGVRGFYENMGYPQPAVAAIARVCVFGTSIHNRGKVPISYDVANWRAVTSDGRQHVLITKTNWLARWKPDGISSDWSILPAQQTLQPGDWAQGFTTLDVPRGTRLTLHYSWRKHGTLHHARLAGPQCGSDAQP